MKVTQLIKLVELIRLVELLGLAAGGAYQSNGIDHGLAVVVDPTCMNSMA